MQVSNGFQREVVGAASGAGDAGVLDVARKIACVRGRREVVIENVGLDKGEGAVGIGLGGIGERLAVGGVEEQAGEHGLGGGDAGDSGGTFTFVETNVLN